MLQVRCVEIGWVLNQLDGAIAKKLESIAAVLLS